MPGVHVGPRSSSGHTAIHDQTKLNARRMAVLRGAGAVWRGTQAHAQAHAERTFLEIAVADRVDMVEGLALGKHRVLRRALPAAVHQMLAQRDGEGWRVLRNLVGEGQCFREHLRLGQDVIEQPGGLVKPSKYEGAGNVRAFF